MVKPLSEAKSKDILGIAGRNTRDGQIRADEFLTELKGRRAVNKFREMRDNDSTIGAIMYAIEQVLRDVPYKVRPADDSDAAKVEAEFVESILVDMDHTLDDHISEALSFLTFGFADFEVVYKRRQGPASLNPKKHSKYSDGRLGIRKLAARAQWTVNKFDIEDRSGEFLGLWQDIGYIGKNYIPASKLIHYKTPTMNGDFSGRSVLRNAYKSYTFLTSLQMIEAIAVEREMHGVPVGRMPAEYLSSNATEDQVTLRNDFERILRDLKKNEQGYALLPSDVYVDTDGKPTNQRLMDIELITSNGSRDIDIDPIIKRYQHDIARSVMAEFLMLGAAETGSYALSKSKNDMFLKSLESYIQTIYDTLNKQLIEPLWRLNGLNFDLMPQIVPGDVAPHDLKELGSYLRNLNGAEINLADQMDIVDELLTTAELPTIDRDIYAESRERAHVKETALMDYYDGPDDNVTNPKQGENEDNEPRPKDEEQ